MLFDITCLLIGMDYVFLSLKINNLIYIIGDDSMRTFYFVSEKPISLLTPRIPDNFLTEMGYEDSTVKRICVSTDIGKCLTALSYSLDGKIFYVYIIQSDKWMKPTLNQVPDAHLTDEHWVLEDAIPQLYCKIKVGNACENLEPLTYKYGDNVAELFRWNYKIIK